MSQILIIDDEEGIRQILSVYAEMVGYTATLLASADDCEVYKDRNCTCSKEKPCADLLLVDQSLKGMSGLDLIQRQTGRGCKLPAKFKAVMTRELSRESFKRIKQLGCYVLQMPVTFEIFENWINRKQPPPEAMNASPG